jgi:hypothetical protein
MNALEQFKAHGNRASFHHASESGNEGSMAYNQESNAMDLYRLNPELRDQMRTIAKDFLWAGAFDRKADAIDLEEVTA